MHPQERLDTDDELPYVIESGGPTAGHERITIQEDKCGNCGYDRVKVSQKHGEAVVTCMNCDAYRFSTNDSWETPDSDKDRLRDDREYADGDGSLNRIGRSKASHFSYDSETYAYDNLSVVRHYDFGRNGSVSLTQTTTDELADMIVALERDRGFLSTVVEERFDKQIRPPVDYNPNAVHVGRYWTQLPQRKVIGMHTSLDHSDLLEHPIHLPPTLDSVVV